MVRPKGFTSWCAQERRWRRLARLRAAYAARPVERPPAAAPAPDTQAAEAPARQPERRDDEATVEASNSGAARAGQRLSG